MHFIASPYSLPVFRANQTTRYVVVNDPRCVWTKCTDHISDKVQTVCHDISPRKKRFEHVSLSGPRENFWIFYKRIRKQTDCHKIGLCIKKWKWSNDIEYTIIDIDWFP